MDMVENNPKEAEATPAPAPTPAEAPKGMAPVTKGNAPGGWNRFAGYKPGQAKDKQKDRRDDRRGRR